MLLQNLEIYILNIYFDLPSIFPFFQAYVEAIIPIIIDISDRQMKAINKTHEYDDLRILMKSMIIYRLYLSFGLKTNRVLGQES